MGRVKKSDDCIIGHNQQPGLFAGVGDESELRREEMYDSFAQHDHTFTVARSFKQVDHTALCRVLGRYTIFKTKRFIGVFKAAMHPHHEMAGLLLIERVRPRLRDCKSTYIRTRATCAI